jgi:hypothetical protein
MSILEEGSTVQCTLLPLYQALHAFLCGCHSGAGQQQRACPHCTRSARRVWSVGEVFCVGFRCALHKVTEQLSANSFVGCRKCGCVRVGHTQLLVSGVISCLFLAVPV